METLEASPEASEQVYRDRNCIQQLQEVSRRGADFLCVDQHRQQALPGPRQEQDLEEATEPGYAQDTQDLNLAREPLLVAAQDGQDHEDKLQAV